MASSVTPQNLWKQMLEKKHVLKFDYGFTIPFIVGAYYSRGFLKETDLQTSYCIRFVLENVLKTATEENPVKIFDCPDLNNEPIFQYLSTKVESSQHISDLKKEHPNIDHLIYWHKKESEISDFDSLVDYLWNKKSTRGGEKYAQLISEYRFSCHKGAWMTFNDDENNFITTEL